MKVLWITPGYPWREKPYGGIFFQTQAQALSNLGVKIVVRVSIPWVPSIVAWISPRHAVQRSAPSFQEDEGVSIQRIRYFGHRFHRDMGRPHLGIARQMLKSLPFSPDIIHGQMAYPEGLAAVEVAKSLGVPCVISLHGSDVNTFATESAIGARRFRKAVTGADRVLCVSKALGEKTLQLTGVTSQYLPIGINLRRFSSTLTRAQAREVLGLPSEKPIVLFIGNLLPEKGVSLALEALDHPALADVQGIFVGAGPLSPSVAVRPNCLWQASVPNTQIPVYLAAADMLILPSYAEGLPTVLVEAGACGTPVIATEVGGIPELLKEGRGTLIPAGSADALREAILNTLLRPKAAQEQAERLRLHVLDSFDADKNAQRLFQIYKELI